MAPLSTRMVPFEAPFGETARQLPSVLIIRV
jgi:hypothetical protein